MAYAGQSAVPKIPSESTGAKWEDLRREARKIEGELDIKLAAYGKLCTSFEYGYTRGESGIAADQLLQSKASDIERLLSRLSDTNESMQRSIGGGPDARSHTLARHRDILHDYQQEFRRHASVAGSARDRADLLGAAGTSGSASASGLGAPGSSMGLLLRERGMVASSHAALDDVMGTAHGVAAGLGQQREVFEGVSGKLGSVGAAFPVVNTLLNAIRRKKNKDNLILGSVVAVCLLFILIYWVNK
ncbi:Golgi SNAP receptor complex member 1-2 [Auxenochlorella protothecoides]|uniref:Golgi SNAP receptor complex member 1 n=1 Tax=Auxenochlorella protothecoides TaxID=3075 RepID=A0A087SAS5_AUXPR|nr:Golgi SNAP receptor complex member 1-2 [Auxenochlorella protothecoides]KFM22829.1 Golgi SNAP receptor complex member 1-2 [Auxenochlorella protothecoides]